MFLGVGWKRGPLPRTDSDCFIRRLVLRTLSVSHPVRFVVGLSFFILYTQDQDQLFGMQICWANLLSQTTLRPLRTSQNQYIKMTSGLVAPFGYRCLFSMKINVFGTAHWHRTQIAWVVLRFISPPHPNWHVYSFFQIQIYHLQGSALKEIE